MDQTSRVCAYDLCSNEFIPYRSTQAYCKKFHGNLQHRRMKRLQRQRTLTCAYEFCNNSFTTTNLLKMYCKKLHGHKQRRLDERVKTQKTRLCEYILCGREFVTTNSAKLYCTKACRTANRYTIKRVPIEVPSPLWPEEKVERLKELHRQGLTTREIGEDPDIQKTKNAVIGKLNRMREFYVPKELYVPKEDVFSGDGCLWSDLNPGDAGFHFCGAKTVAGKPYCAEHSATAYISRQDNTKENILSR